VDQLGTVRDEVRLGGHAHFLELFAHIPLGIGMVVNRHRSIVSGTSVTLNRRAALVENGRWMALTDNGGRASGLGRGLGRRLVPLELSIGRTAGGLGSRLTGRKITVMPAAGRPAHIDHHRFADFSGLGLRRHGLGLGLGPRLAGSRLILGFMQILKVIRENFQRRKKKNQGQPSGGAFHGNTSLRLIFKIHVPQGVFFY
jgi:hypothetical protein